MASNTTINAGVTSSVINSPHQCIWELSVTDGEKVLTVGYPLTIEFNIVRNTFATANTATFNIYNLSPATRSANGSNKDEVSGLLFQDRFNTSSNKFVTFKAGYNNNLVTCFFGRIQEAYSHRQGTEVITSIQCMDMGIPTDYINVTFEAGTKKRDAYKNVVNSLEGLALGAIGQLEGTYQTPVTLEGTPLEVLNEISGGNTFIDNGLVNCLQSNECLDIGVKVLKAETGLLNTPQRRGAEIIAEGIFNPNATVGQLMEVKSETASEFSGTFCVTGITHTGVISGAVGGQRITRYNFLVGALLPSGQYINTGVTDAQSFTKVRGEDRTPVDSNVGSDVYSVYYYIKNHNGRPPHTRVGKTPYLWENLVKNNNSYDEILREITPAYLQNCKIIAEQLYNFMQAYFSGKTITINSGWRSVENNARAHGAKNNARANGVKESAHLRGAAMDFTINGMSTRTAFKTFYNSWSGFTYQFNITGNSSVIHVQSTRGAGRALRLQGQQF